VEDGQEIAKDIMKRKLMVSQVDFLKVFTIFLMSMHGAALGQILQKQQTDPLVAQLEADLSPDNAQGEDLK
jgi:hypothetical protein